MPFDMGTGLRNSRGPAGTAFVVGTKANIDTAPVAAGSDTEVLSELTIQVDPDNTTGVFFGDTASQTIQLNPGQSYTIAAGKVTAIEVKGQAGDTDITVNYMGTVA